MSRKPPPSLNPISAKLFCKRSQVAFMPSGVVFKDERRTSNIERPTSNEKPMSNFEWLFAFLFSPPGRRPLRAGGRFDTRNENLN